MTTTIIPPSSGFVVVDVLTPGQVAFDYDFLATATVDLAATYTALDGTETHLIGGTDFTATGLDDPDGGTITITSGLVTEVGATLTIYRDILIERENDYQRDLHAADLNREMGDIYQILQQLDRDGQTAIRTELGEPPLTIESGIADGLTLMKQGDKLVAGPDIVALADEAVTDATAAALAAQAAAEAAAGSAQSSEDAAADYAAAASMQAQVPIYPTIAGMAAISVPAGTTSIRVNGNATQSDGGGGLFSTTDVGGGIIFTSLDGRPWYKVKDVNNGRLADGPVFYNQVMALTPAQQRQAKQNIGVPFSGWVNAGPADHTVLAADNGKLINVNVAAANRTISLPKASDVGVGFTVGLRRFGSGANTATITPDATLPDTINQGANWVLRAADQVVWLMVVAAGDWRVVAGALDDYIAYAKPQTLTPARQGQAIANIGGGVLAGFRNKLINGDFDIWQRATSQTNNAYGSDDRWHNGHVGSTKTAGRQAFTLGQTDVPGAPTYFSRTVVTSVAGAGNYARKTQRVESVTTLSGKKCTVTFYAKADAAKNIAIELAQYFGSGGSPSASIIGIGVQKFALTTAWQKFSVAIDVPSVAGKTLGTDGMDEFELNFWFDAGSSFNDRAASLGQQSGTFDIAHVSLVEGDATAEVDPFSPRPIGVEQFLCERYLKVLGAGVTGTEVLATATCTSTTNVAMHILFAQPMRAIPALSTAGTFAARGGLGDIDASAPAINVPTPKSCSVNWTIAGGTVGRGGYITGRADVTARIFFDAEL